MTKEQEKISRRNRATTKKLLNVPKGYVMHHINPDWLYTDVERYILWNPEDLQIMSISEHAKLHMTGKKLPQYWCDSISESHKGIVLSEESKAKKSLSLKLAYAEGRRKPVSKKGEDNPMYGKKFTEEHKEKLRQKKLGENNPFYGTHYYNNGIVEVRAKQCPDGYIKGRLKFNK